MAKIYHGHEFEALRERFKDQVELSHRLMLIDLKVFTGFLTIQIVMGSWLALNRDKISSEAGLFVIDVAIAVFAITLLYNQYQRRKEVIGTVKNCNEALGYEEPGVYLDGRALNAHTKPRYGFRWYAAGIIVSVIGIALVLFG
jgi:hypothetical protein